MMFRGPRAFRPKKAKFQTSFGIEADGTKFVQIVYGHESAKMPLPEGFDEWPEARRQNLMRMAAEEMTANLRKGLR